MLLRTKLINGIEDLNLKIDDYVNRLKLLLELKGYSDITWDCICSLRCKIKRLVIVRTTYKKASLRDVNIITGIANTYKPVNNVGRPKTKKYSKISNTWMEKRGVTVL